MKRLPVLAAFCFVMINGYAQRDTVAPPTYTLYPLPQFSILLPDSTTWFTKKDLPKNKQTFVMVFSPDCEHCQHETELIRQHLSDFKRTQILMVTPMSFDKMQEFYKKYGLGQYKNVTVGYDPNFFFTSYFKMRMFPFIAIYDKKYALIKTFEGSPPIDDLLKYVK